MSELIRKDRGLYAAKIYEAARRAGFDPDFLCRQFGFSPDDFNNLDYGFNHEFHRIFWPAVEEYTKCPDIGFVLGQHLPSSYGDFFSTLHFSYPNFGASLLGNIELSRLASDAMEWSLGEDEEGFFIQVRSPCDDIQTARHLFECLFLGLILFYTEITNGLFCPSKIKLACQPPLQMGNRKDIYGCDAIFNCKENRLYFHPSMLAIPMATPDEILVKMHQSYARSIIKKIEEEDILQLTRNVIFEMLPLGDITLEQVSQRLSLTPAELKYRLEKMNTHFLKEREACRRSFVMTKLKENQASITDIALQAGFSEPSTFYRAFKRWSDGETPVAFRARHLTNPAH